MNECVRLAPGADENAFAQLMAQLVRDSVKEHADRRALLERMFGRVALTVSDLNVRVTLVFDGSTLTVHDDLAGIPDVSIIAPSEYITKMSLVELRRPKGTLQRFPLLRRAVFPDHRGTIVQEIWQATRRGDVEVVGLWTNLPLLGRLVWLISALEPA